jgi:hypothetical protein
MLTPSRALLRGFPTLVGETVSTTTTDEMRPFSYGGAPGSPGTITLEATSGTFTAFTGNLQQSSNRQTDWVNFMTFDFQASPVFIFDAVPGISYRLSPSTVTQSDPPDVYATLN